MFFDEIFVNNKVLSRVWRAGNNQTLESSDNNISLPKICNKLDQWVGSEEMDPRRRMSLRTSAVLIEGVTKLYKKELQQLTEDVAKLDEEMVIRNRRKSISSEDTWDSSDLCFTPELMMRRPERESEISIEGHINEPQIPIKDPEINHSFSSISENDIMSMNQPIKRRRLTIGDCNGQSSKRRVIDVDKISDRSKDLSFRSDYPSTVNLTFDRSSDLSSEGVESPSDQSSEDQNRQSDQNEESPDDPSVNGQKTKRSSLKIRVLESQLQMGEIAEKSSSPTFTDIFNFVAGLPNDDESGRVIDNAERSDPNAVIAASDNNSDNVTADNDKSSDNGRPDNDKNSDDGRTGNDKNPDHRHSQNNKAQNSDHRSRDDKAQNISSDNRRTSLDIHSEAIREIENISDGCETSIGSHRSMENDQMSVILGSNHQRVIRKVHRKKKVSKSVVKNPKKDQASQTISFQPDMRERDTNSEQSLPFGQMLIYDTYRSRFPSKIVFSYLRRQ